MGKRTYLTKIFSVFSGLLNGYYFCVFYIIQNLSNPFNPHSAQNSKKNCIFAEIDFSKGFTDFGSL